MTSPVLRPGTAADALALARFAARTFFETFGPDNSAADMEAHLSAKYGEAQQTRELTDPAFVTLLMEADGNIVAFARLHRHTPPPCVTDELAIELLRFYVDRPWHGQGLAQRLVDAACEAARSAGGRTLWLSVWERNPRAIAFYAKCGFRDVGIADFWVGSDRQADRIMTRALVGSPGDGGSPFR